MLNKRTITNGGAVAEKRLPVQRNTVEARRDESGRSETFGRDKLCSSVTSICTLARLLLMSVSYKNEHPLRSAPRTAHVPGQDALHTSSFSCPSDETFLDKRPNTRAGRQSTSVETLTRQDEGGGTRSSRRVGRHMRQTVDIQPRVSPGDSLRDLHGLPQGVGRG